MTASQPATPGSDGEVCQVCGYDRPAHEGDGEMVHAFRPAAPSEPPAADSPTAGTETCGEWVITRRCARPVGHTGLHRNGDQTAGVASYYAAPSPVDTEPPAVTYVLPSGSFLPPEEARAARERGLQAFEKVMGPVVVVTESPAEAVAPWPYGDAVQPDIEDDEPPAEAQQDDERDEQVAAIERAIRECAEDQMSAGDWADLLYDSGIRYLAARPSADTETLRRARAARWLHEQYGEYTQPSSQRVTSLLNALDNW